MVIMRGGGRGGEVEEGKGGLIVMEGDGWGGEHTVQHTDDVL